MRSCVLAATVQNTVKPFVLTYIGNKWGMAMDTKRFDQITKLFAARRTRRAAISSTAGLAATAAIAPRLGHVSAQEATPTGADEVTISTEPHPGAGIPSKPTFLFVQPFEGGTWAPKPGENGVFSLTLTGMAAQTVYFSDRPDRIFGVWQTQRFLDNLGFTPDNPPNAALVARTDDGEEEILVIELLNPIYDATTGTLTYDAKILADYSGEGLAHAARQQTDYTLPESFAQGGLFIDSGGCNIRGGLCIRIVNGLPKDVGYLPIEQCPDADGTCKPCDPDMRSSSYGKICHDRFPDQCFYDRTPDHPGVTWNCYADWVDY